ncbi:MAG: nicotinate (nicotinamide) nucleotide adenylyltransferase [Chlamydiota bacterium]
MSKKVKVGLYGGTFDPLHFGHLNLAVGLQEAHGLNEVWFCPALISPHKQEYPPIADNHRWNMLQAVIDEIPNSRVVDLELKRQGPSYTVETLEQIEDSHRELYLLLGEDSADNLHRWHQPEKIVDLAQPLIARRSHAPWRNGPNDKINQAIEAGLTDLLLMEISSTIVRERLNARKYCGHLVPAKVLDYIYYHGLYFNL